MFHKFSSPPPPKYLIIIGGQTEVAVSVRKQMCIKHLQMNGTIFIWTASLRLT